MSRIVAGFALFCVVSSAPLVSRAQETRTLDAHAPNTHVQMQIQDTTARRGIWRVTLPVARHAMSSGDTVRAGDIALLDTTLVWHWNTAPDTTRAITGWVARRPIRAGELLRAPAIMAPPVISAGATVSAIWQEGSLRLVLTGVATNSAAVGAPVGVRIDRVRRLDGVAIAPNTVRLR
jgi:flagella basal body P-ring formation protein FlgA